MPTDLEQYRQASALLERDRVSDVYFDLQTIFNNALAEAPRVAERVATTIRMDAPLARYKWLGSVPTMQRWIGERTISKLRAESQVIENEDWANGITVDRDDIDDDARLGLVKPRIAQLATAGLKAIEEQVVLSYVASVEGAAQSGASGSVPVLETYDGENLFSATHTAAGEGYGGPEGIAQQSNLTDDGFDENGVALERAYEAMLGFRDDRGQPLGIVPRILLHGPSIWSEVRKVLLVPTLSGGGANPNFQLVVPVMSHLITGPQWFLIDDTQGVMPVILQIRRDPQFRAPVTSIDDFEAYKNKGYHFGADATFGIGAGLWQVAYGSAGDNPLS
jgi:phage major head subunit gpT-like protein